MLVKILALMILTGVASIISAITSFGTSTIIVPILTLVYPFNTVLLFSGLINLLVNFVKAILFRTHIKWQLIFFFGMPALLVSFLGTFILPFVPEKILLRMLGVFMISYVVFILKKPNWRLPLKSYITFLGGGFTGISAAIFGMQGATRTLFLSAYNLPKNVFIFTASILGLIVDCARVGGYAYHQFAFSQPELMPALLGSIPMVFIGSYVGKQLVDSITQEQFRGVITFALAFIAIRFIIWA